jgi:hypothetical protein
LRPTRSGMWWLLGFSILCGCNVVNDTGASLQSGSERLSPQVQVLPLESMRSVSARPLTGQASALLVGQVDHPLIGALQAEAYVIPEYPSVVLPNLADYEVQAELHLIRQAVYGDTTAPLRLRVRLITQSWTDARFPADTTLPTGEVLGLSEPFRARDSLVRIPLGRSWTDLFRSAVGSEADFSSRIHGFVLEPVEGRAAVGFDGARSYVRIWYRREGVRDSVSLALKSRANAVRRLTTAPSAVVVQGGVGNRALVSFALQLPAQAAVHRAVLWLYAQPAVPDPGSVWEPVEQLSLYTSTETGEPDRLLATGRYRTSEGGYAFSSPVFSNYVQELVLGKTPSRPLIVMAASEKNTLSWVVLRNPGSSEPKPRLEVFWTSPPGMATER